MNHRPSAGRALAWIAALVTALAGLLRLGDQLPLPPWPAPDASATWRWLERTDPGVTAFALIRLAAVVVVAWLLASTLALVAGHLLRLPALVAASDRITVPSARRLIHHAVGAGLAVTLASTTVGTLAGPVAAVPAASASPFAPAGTDDPSGPPSGGPATDPARGGGSPGTPAVAPPVLHALPDGPVLVHLGPAASAGEDGAAAGAPPPSTSPAADVPQPAPAPTEPTPAEPAPTAATTPRPPPTLDGVGPVAPAADRADHPAPGPMTSLSPPAPDGLGEHHHTIAAGDHLWGVAEQTLAARWSRSPEPAEIAAYLHRLIEANRGVLAVPDEPDLVFPGQVFVLPDT